MINIAFILDESYFMPTCVAMTSIICNKNFDTVYNFYIVAKEVSENSIQILKKFEEINIKINIINVENCKKYKDLEKKIFQLRLQHY